MDIKKLFTAGASVALVSMMAACSDDPSSPNNPVNPPVDGTSSAGQQNPVASSSNSNGGGNSVLVSSASLSDKDEPQMACSEIMYNAADGSPLEWVEIYIAGGSDMANMQDYLLRLSGDVDFTFPAEPLKKGEYVVVTNDAAEFAKAYPTFAGRVFGGMTGKLVNEGGVVNVKVRGEGDVTCAFSSEPPWPSLADGKGRSLVYTGGIAAQSVSWCASALPNGNPGVGNDACIDVVNTVRINEVKPSILGTAGFEASWVELYNSGKEPVDVTGWTLFVKLRNEKLTINAGVVPAGGYLLLDGAKDFSDELVVSDQGGEIYLYGMVEGQESSIWLPAGKGVSGVVDVADGSIAQGPLAEATPGAMNSALKLGSVYIDEIHYHPDEKDALPFEFLELVNATAAPISLYNSTVKKGWKVEGVNIEFGPNDIIPANGRILLIPSVLEDVNDAGWGADLVRTTYSVPADVAIYTYNGKLSNRGETIAVKEPYSSTTKDGIVKYFYIWHDATLYSDAWAGLTDADGVGYSLQRANVTTMGYGPSAWKAAEPTFGK
ncbi:MULTISPECIES: lamin tail domain-containing protein [unclassified Fibrobacter]|uniref:lamin tail domain-containing protein n=1 Tax=unclassified Fibrobacter TaxID=2634177 RepID=UPI000D6B3ABF|nr:MULTISPECIES: lamin tail domain-containing protein [unclassified Fibrobacter]PWJ66239.1 lamin tail-like protein [Fibrobacter sp. UWR4]PZW69443.1 lamin tail-like protein [Fibrobacter sp. UWR1]